MTKLRSHQPDDTQTMFGGNTIQIVINHFAETPAIFIIDPFCILYYGPCMELVQRYIVRMVAVRLGPS